jgi:hypothetical protein
MCGSGLFQAGSEHNNASSSFVSIIPPLDYTEYILE